MTKPLSSIPVFFQSDMAASAGSFSPSAGKPPLVVADWRAHGLPIEVRGFMPVDEETLALAHDPAFVRGVLRGEIANGFGNKSLAVAASLRYTTGAMLAAAEEALTNGRVGCAPVSGFHHAGYAQAEGFCTFNGLMVTALALRLNARVTDVGILDLDQHWGNGTQAIMQKLGTTWIKHHSSGRDSPGPEEAEEYLDKLPDLVREFFDCSVLLYQAGADAHVKDPLGGWMTDEQLARRDRIVFSTAASIKLPVAWNLAGGYQVEKDGGIGPVLAIHRRTMEACVGVHT